MTAELKAKPTSPMIPLEFDLPSPASRAAASSSNAAMAWPEYTGAQDDDEFVQLMDVIDCMPPDLYEMVISPRPADVPREGFVTGHWIARFEVTD